MYKGFQKVVSWGPGGERDEGPPWGFCIKPKKGKLPQRGQAPERGKGQEERYCPLSEGKINTTGKKPSRPKRDGIHSSHPEPKT